MNKITKNPYGNSVLAELYIILIVFVTTFFGKENTPDTHFDAIAAISLFVLSASVMGYLFLGEPLQLFLNGEKQKAVSFFMKTVVAFAIITLIAFIILKVIR